MLQWFMEEASEEESTPEMLARRLLTVNFAAIHTSSMVRSSSTYLADAKTTSSQTFTHALYHLAANPEFIGPMRQEVDAIVEAVGWSKEALGKMHLVDSFMKETLRLNGLGAGEDSMPRVIVSGSSIQVYHSFHEPQGPAPHHVFRWNSYPCWQLRFCRKLCHAARQRQLCRCRCVLTVAFRRNTRE